MNKFFFLLLIFSLVACHETDPESLIGTYVQTSSFLLSDQITNAEDRETLEQRMISLIDTSEESIDFAISDFESEAVAASLVNAQNRGVFVRVIGDEDQRDQSGFVFLERNLADFSTYVHFGDGILVYSPEPTVILTREGEKNQMAHNFLVVDQQQILSLSGGLNDVENTYQMGFEINSSPMAEDFSREFQVMFGGTFAMTLDSFGGIHKPDTNARILYMTSDGVYGLYFGPQERLLKRVIDAVYNARSSVQIIGSEFSNAFLLDALRYKASVGFSISAIFDEESLSLPYSLVEELAQILHDEQADLTVQTAPNIDVSIVIIDGQPSPIDGLQYPTRAFVVTAPFASAGSTVIRGTDRETRLSDGFIDAHMFEIREMGDLRPEGLDDVQTLFDHLNEIGADL